MSDGVAEGRALYQKIGLALGPALSLAVLLLFTLGIQGWSETADTELGWPAIATAAVAVLMAVWWATEAIPVPVTAFLPLVLFPLLNIQGFRDTAAPYAHPIVYLFLGGFIMAAAVERCGLHRRIALAIFDWVGTGARGLVGGFMLAAAVISMWMSNTSTTLMLLPIAMSVVTLINETVPSLSETEQRNFNTVVLLGLAYGATIGGMSTLVGTPPNAFMAGFMADTYNVEIDFARWMLVGIPVSVVMLPLAWLLLTRVLFPVDFRTSDETRRHLQRLRVDVGTMSVAEQRTAFVFLLLVVGWVFRQQIVQIPGLSMVTDSGIVMLMAVLLFVVPAGGGTKGALMAWPDMAKLPWGVLILFGGGLSLASAVSGSGLALWLGQQLAGLGEIHIIVLVLAATALVIFLTELTSNLATTATFLPVIAAIAVETGQDPLVFVIPVSLAASCAFMLPVATPPNAIVFSSGHLSIPRMVKAGFWLNVTGVILLSIVALTLAPAVF